MEIIEKYFPELTSIQKERFAALPQLYAEWNQMINVISRKDVENIMLHHVLHSLSIAKYISFKEGSKIFDLGTGGGFPGIPLAILFPESDFTLVDGTGKKIKVVNAIIESLNLTNAKGLHARAEEIKGKYDFVVSRAVAKVDQLIHWSRRLISNNQQNRLPNGLIALKGGNLVEELKLLPKWEYYEVTPISNYFSEPFFEEKNIVYIQG
ncbi:MAG TPA: 16S rRNA (guanine(527)-N(7))-methyltransferase RsmG [Saprospiraceae bacterium]|nr:16S rRNA (guanine(527)-N(7))-methyltransferase RsmG [Saprospiraceae bacterium]MCB9328881.1 16S rRNA (guanine(527)-N(7))-methyltransferase RsmG [Lewinellaceae bacterium]HPK08838.1 16S rRNA (guanine(527)-N(7))-methyltransferase RsmG [Saprospiraceae bacterium]HPQ20874.1 16S rRNA (guanine(527)-N(7))-methyltransferase RsmG [Saprospiraceae bacterium]